MADSALTLAYQGMAESIGHYLGYQRKTAASYDAGPLADIHDCLDSGYRRFLMHREIWRFLRKNTTLWIWPDVSATISTAVYDSVSLTTITATTASFHPSMVGKTFTVGSNTYAIASYTSTTIIVVEGDASAETGTFTIDSEDVFDLPDDFGSIRGRFQFPDDTNIAPPMNRNTEEITKQMSYLNNPGTPHLFAIRQKSSWDGTEGPRYEVRFYFPTDTAYEMRYDYSVFVPYKIRTETSYAIAGMPHTQTILDCAMAHGERRYRRTADGPEEQAAVRSLEQSGRQDDELAADTMGYNRDRSDDRFPHIPERIPTVEYNGVVI